MDIAFVLQARSAQDSRNYPEMQRQHLEIKSSMQRMQESVSHHVTPSKVRCNIGLLNAHSCMDIMPLKYRAFNVGWFFLSFFLLFGSCQLTHSQQYYFWGSLLGLPMFSFLVGENVHNAVVVVLDSEKIVLRGRALSFKSRNDTVLWLFLFFQTELWWYHRICSNLLHMPWQQRWSDRLLPTRCLQK